MNMKKQVLYTIVLVLCIALITISGTYAFFMFSINGNAPSNTDSSNFEISYVGGGSTFNGTLDLVTNRNDGYKKTLKIKTLNSSVNAKLNLYLQIESISAELAAGDAFKWEVYGYNSSSQQVYSKTGTFKNYSANSGSNIINLVNYDYTLTNDETTFDIYLWLDIAKAGNEVMGSTFTGHIAARTEQFTGIVKQ